MEEIEGFRREKAKAEETLHRFRELNTLYIIKQLIDNKIGRMNDSEVYSYSSGYNEALKEMSEEVLNKIKELKA